MTRLPENLKMIRLIRGYSLRQIAQMIDRSPGTISNWEHGKVSPDADALFKMCEIYKITPNELLGWEPSKEIEAFKAERADALKELAKLKAQKSDIDQRIKAYTELLSHVE